MAAVFAALLHARRGRSLAAVGGTAVHDAPARQMRARKLFLNVSVFRSFPCALSQTLFWSLGEPFFLASHFSTCSFGGITMV